VGNQTTVDDLFRRVVASRPHAIALVDPPNRLIFADGEPRRLTYAEADRLIGAIAARLRRLGLQPDSVVAILLPNTVEAVLTILGVWRAQMIAAPLPVLWRRTETVQALERIGAKAIVTCARIGDFRACEVAAQAAEKLFPIRHVCGFGAGLPDGVIKLDDLPDADAREPRPAHVRETDAALHVAAVTWDVSPRGAVAVARNHAQLIAGGLATVLTGRIESGSTILAGCAHGSFAGLALSVLPWLLVGGTLALHHGFDADAFAAQCNEHRCGTLVAPGALVPRLAAAGLLAHADLRNVLAVWRAPERLSTSSAWQHPSAGLVDMLVFGETALLGSLRGADGRPSPLPSGTIYASWSANSHLWIADTAPTAAGTLALRGPMIPQHPFPPGAERSSLPHLKADAAGFVDTGYSCRFDRATATYQVTAPPPGLVSVGGYRFVMSELDMLARRTNEGAALAALPNAITGHRLAGIAENPDSVRAELLALGLNPLVTDAFRGHRKSKAA
jgi:hypothetical protein